MFKWSYRIAQVWGIPIRVHITLLFVLPLFASDLSRYEDFNIVHGFILALGVAASITLHELGHSFIALRKGCRVREILLTPIGGVAQMESMPQRPRDEMLMAVSGPAVSLALFGLLLPSGWLLYALPGMQRVGGVTMILGATNLMLALFNLIPAFPMDGGRILRSWLTPRYGRLRATFAAATIGKVVAVVGVLTGLHYHHWTLVLIGMFIYFAAGREYRAVELREKSALFGQPFYSFEPPDTFSQSSDSDDVMVGPPPYDSRGRSHSRIVRENPDRF